MTETMQVSKDLVFNYFKDCSKRQVNPIELAKLLKQYRQENNLTQNILAEQIGIPKTTLNNWESFVRITEEQWKQLDEKGYSKTQITNAVRNNRVQDLMNGLMISDFNSILKQIRKQLDVYVKDKPKDWNSESSILIQELKDILCKIEKRVRG